MPKSHTIASLGLNVEAARNGKHWELLPVEFRSKIGIEDEYPLPSKIEELAELAMIPVPSYKRNAGAAYLSRVQEAYKGRLKRRQSLEIDVVRRSANLARHEKNFQTAASEQRERLREVVEGVRAEAAKAVAGLNDLFALGREGIEGQMRAHLKGDPWKGEIITGSAFRECFRMVTQAVKGLGLPSEQRDRAAEAVLEQVAESMKSTQEAVGLAAPPAGEQPH